MARPRPSRVKRLVPSSRSSCLMRVVTFEGTRCSFAAALLMPPTSATVLKIKRADRSIVAGAQYANPDYSLFWNGLASSCADAEWLWIYRNLRTCERRILREVAFDASQYCFCDLALI